MAHEMTENDSAVYYKEKAWHGLGTVVDYTLSLNSALRQSGLGWGVEKTNGISANGIWTQDYRATVRTDTQEILGIVSPRYQVVENEEVFRLAEYFSDVATVESAGSIQGGRKCYLLLHQDSFEATHNDPISRYMALFWGHDGNSSIIVKPTSIRVVCKNTMDMALAQDTQNKLSIKHHGDVDAKIEEAWHWLRTHRTNCQSSTTVMWMLRSKRQKVLSHSIDILATSSENRSTHWPNVPSVTMHCVDSSSMCISK